MMVQKDREIEKSALITSSALSPEEKDGRTLRKSLGFSQLFAYIVGILIGSGVYISPGLVAKYSNNMGTALTIWVASGFICLLGSFCLCELAVALKKTGGYYIFIKEIYGDFAGFFIMWAQVIMIGPAGLGVIAITIAEHIVGSFADVTSTNGIWMVKGIAVICLFISFSINITNVSFTSKTQKFFTSMQILSMVFFISVGIWKMVTGERQNYANMFKSGSGERVTIRGLGVAFYSALWSYDGWGFITTVTEEIRNRERDLWLAIVTGIPFVIACYVLINLAFMSVLSHHEMGQSSIVAMRFIEKSLGAKVASILPIIVALNCFGTLNAFNFFVSRIALSAAREGHLPEPMAYIHKERSTPIPALLTMFLLSSILLLALGSRTVILVTYFGFAIWITYGLALFGTIVLRITQPDLPRPFKVSIVNPVLMSLISAFLILAPFFQYPIECSICFGILMLSVPLYFTAVRGMSSMPYGLRKFKEKLYELIKWHFGLVLCIYFDGHQGYSSDEEDNDSNY